MAAVFVFSVIAFLILLPVLIVVIGVPAGTVIAVLWPISK